MTNSRQISTACRGVIFGRGVGKFARANFLHGLETYHYTEPQTALYWRLPGSHPRTQGCADLDLHAIFD